jgi:hypothetical protein
MTAPLQPRPLATRARKARNNGSCVQCPSPVIRGQRIGKIHAGWAHIRCIIGQLRETAAAALQERNPGGGL